MGTVMRGERSLPWDSRKYSLEWRDRATSVALGGAGGPGALRGCDPEERADLSVAAEHERPCRWSATASGPGRGARGLADPWDADRRRRPDRPRRATRARRGRPRDSGRGRPCCNHELTPPSAAPPATGSPRPGRGGPAVSSEDVSRAGSLAEALRSLGGAEPVLGQGPQGGLPSLSGSPPSDRSRHGTGPISARNRTDLGTEPDRSRHGTGPISARNRTDLGTEPVRSRHGTGPISARNRTDLGAELNRSRRKEGEGVKGAETTGRPGDT